MNYKLKSISWIVLFFFLTMILSLFMLHNLLQALLSFHAAQHFFTKFTFVVSFSCAILEFLFIITLLQDIFQYRQYYCSLPNSGTVANDSIIFILILPVFHLLRKSWGFVNIDFFDLFVNLFSNFYNKKASGFEEIHFRAAVWKETFQTLLTTLNYGKFHVLIFSIICI